jgi:hypothetical protein
VPYRLKLSIPQLKLGVLQETLQFVEMGYNTKSVGLLSIPTKSTN